MTAVKIGIDGPVGAGKTQLIERLTRALSQDISMAAITNDIYTIEDAKILSRNSVLPLDRIVGLETGGCPHTAIREDTSMNQAAIDRLEQEHPDLEVVFVESGGDNLSATFSPELVDFSIYIIDVAQGEKIPRKAGQGMIKSDLFIINKTDLAPHVPYRGNNQAEEKAPDQDRIGGKSMTDYRREGGNTAQDPRQQAQ